MFPVQRLILYFIISALMDAIDRMLQGAYYKELPTNWRLCQALAFLSQYWALCMLVAIFCLVLEMFLQVIARKETTHLQLAYPAATFLLPAIVSWIPFVTKSYGFTGCFCDIVYTNPKTCKENITGMATEIGLWWVPFNVTVVVGGVAYVWILCHISRQKKQYSALVEVDRNIMYNQFIKEIGYFKWLPLIIFIINVIPLAAQIHNFISKNQPWGPLWAIAAVIKGLQGGVTAIVITLDPNTRRVLNCRSFVGAWYSNVLCKKSAEEYPIIAGKLTDSVNFSDGKGTRLT